MIRPIEAFAQPYKQTLGATQPLLLIIDELSSYIVGQLKIKNQPVDLLDQLMCRALKDDNIKADLKDYFAPYEQIRCES